MYDCTETNERSGNNDHPDKPTSEINAAEIVSLEWDDVPDLIPYDKPTVPDLVPYDKSTGLPYFQVKEGFCGKSSFLWYFCVVLTSSRSGTTVQ
jgi:hypothetical protein